MNNRPKHEEFLDGLGNVPDVRGHENLNLIKT
jgi:hypothetical protein